MVGPFNTDIPVHTLRHYRTFLNVENVTEDTYELDETNQRFQH
jgi:hypothetical protein